ncbi:CHAT domain-containing protein [Anabaena azotica]|uniref:CHAT domain-containing protein n=1 Tax=Anabaena azotica TaxID=197653 RepID=UPI0039A417C6
MLKNRQKFTALFLGLLTLIFTLVIPILFPEKVIGTEHKIKPNSFLISQISNALKLEQQGKEYYDIGSFAEAAKIWQKAAEAYGKDEDGKNRNLINKAKSLQSLGLYPEACSQIMLVFTNFNSSCLNEQFKNSDFQKKFINQIQEQPSSLNKIRGLRLLAEILLKLDIYIPVTQVNFEKIADHNGNKIKLPKPQNISEILLQESEKYPEEKSAILLSLGNIERSIGNKDRDKLNYFPQIDTILSNKCNNEFNNVLNTDILSDEDKYQYEIKCSNNDNLKLYQQAFRHYSESFKDYQQATNDQTQPLTKIQAKLNQLTLLLDMQEWWNEQISKNSKNDWSDLRKDLDNKIEYLLNPIRSDLGNLPENSEIIRELVYAKINFSNSLIRLNINTNKDNFLQQQIPELNEVDKLLSTAIQQAHTFADKQAESQGLSNLARLRELQASRQEDLTRQDKLTQAKNLTEQALSLLNDMNVDNRQILYRYRHQLGRILKASGNIEGALTSYAEAWNILQSLRADLVTSADNQFSFRQNVEPVYREFIDLLLQSKSSGIDLSKLVLLNNITTRYSSDKDETGKNILDNPLNVARLVMESLQLAELDNFFQEPCSPPIDKLVQLENIDAKAAVIYPIILENQLQVMLFKKNKSPYLSPVIKIAKTEVNDTLENLADLIYTQIPKDGIISASSLIEDQTIGKDQLNKNKKQVFRRSQQVYDWLIKPLEKNHQLDQIETLVFVLLDRSFQKIPIAALYNGKDYLIEKYNIALSLGQQLINPKPIKPENIEILAAGMSKSVSARGNTFLELENVNAELTNIKNLKARVRVNPIILCDENTICQQPFTKSNFKAKMKSSPTVVHLSTHGIFSSNREQTFIVTGDTDEDNTIDINNFQNLLNPQGKNRNKNIELLVLSACQTASGDEKAILGMAGVALRSGASSTIASLWPVSDKATAELMKRFYQNLTNRDQNLTNRDQKMTRATALRNAQISLIEQKEYDHPLYWAAFTLIGNWL